MGVDVGSGREGAVAQPNLDLLHRNAVAQQQAGTGVTKIVEADLAQAVLADHPAEMLGHVVGAQDLPTLIHADVIQIVPAVRAFEQPPVFDLPLLLSQQQFLNSGDQRQRAEAGLGFEHVLPYRDILPQLVLGSTRC